MNTFDAVLARIRDGEILHLRRGNLFTPVIELLNRSLERNLAATRPFGEMFSRLEWPDLERALQSVVSELDCTREHFITLAQALVDNGISAEEGLLEITLDKSMRLCLSGQHKKNYGYFVHRDSWFDLAPDGVNIVLYLTDVPAFGNTQFYENYFGKETPYDPTTRRLLDESGLTRVTAFNCKAGDVLAFSGDHLHSGALCETNRLSVEFRLSRHWSYGRPDQGIVYRGVSSFVESERESVLEPV